MFEPCLDLDLGKRTEKKKKSYFLNNQRKLNTDWALDENKELLQ